MKRGLISLTVALAAVTAHPAPGDVIFSGGCLVSMTLTFSPRATYTSLSAASVCLSMSGTCVSDADTGDLPDSLIKTITVGGSGSASLDNCTITAMNGFYTAGFSPQPAPPGSSGTFVISGNLAAVSVTFVGSAPLLVGEGVLAGLNVGPATTCAGSGAASMSFTGPFAFSDP